MDDAIKKVKQLTASALGRKERIEEELKLLEREYGQRTADKQLAVSAGESDLIEQLSTILHDLEQQIDVKRGELAQAEVHFDEMVRELENVENAAADYERGKLRAPVDTAMPDPFAPSAEDRALENVRTHIENLDARVELEDELAGNRARDQALERKLAELEKKDEEARVRAQLEALKAQRRKEKSGSSSSSSEEDDSGSSLTNDGPPKKTM